MPDTDSGERCEPGPGDAELLDLRRLRELDALLPALAGALDLREVFGKVSEIAQRALPHDLLGVGVIDPEDPAWALRFAVAGALPPEMPTRTRVADDPGLRELEPSIVADLRAAPGWLPPPLQEVALRGGVRSLLRVAIVLEGRIVGTLVFAARAPTRYTSTDIAVASRVRDHIALALSHQRLAEARERLAAERERSARAEARVQALSEELAAAGGYGRVVGDSAAWRRVVEQAAKVAPTETTALVVGESGTGKEVVARLIHARSRRARGAFVAINCAALPEALLESELFGFERGAFSGAVQAKPGRIEQASGGTLFLDEIGEMSLIVQAKLLRFLEQREVQRLGATKAQKADVRVIAATNRDLKAASARGAFREDLYYRVSVFEIRTPPLRDRPEDILALAQAFLVDLGASLGRPAAGLSREARDRLIAYPWPGNVRELRNVLERASILCDGGLITTEHLAIADAPPPVVSAAASAAAIAERAPRPEPPPPRPEPAAGEDLESLERAAIERVLAKEGFNRTRAAKRLGITRGQLYLRLKKYGIEPPNGKGDTDPR